MYCIPFVRTKISKTFFTKQIEPNELLRSIFSNLSMKCKHQKCHSFVSGKKCTGCSLLQFNTFKLYKLIVKKLKIILKP